jgi:hypothetical protein
VKCKSKIEQFLFRTRSDLSVAQSSALIGLIQCVRRMARDVETPEQLRDAISDVDIALTRVEES